MSVSPSIRLVAYEDRAGCFVFVAVPDERGRYLRTDRSVVLVACPICKAIKGEPCKGRQGYGGMTHAARRTVAHRHKGRQDDLIDAVDPRAPDPELPPQILGCITLIEPRPV